MARHDDLPGIATILLGMTERPGYGFGCIVEGLIDGDLGQQAIVGANHHIALVLEALGNLLIAYLEAATMKPHDNGAILLILREIDIEFQTLLGIGIALAGVADV